MTWTYGNSPSTSTRDAVRLLCSDVDTTDQLLSDEEIAYFLAENGTAQQAAAAAARQLALQFARAADSKTVGDLALQYRSRAATFAALADRLETAGASTVCGGKAGGVYTADKQTYAQDPTRSQPVFEKGEFDHPNTQQPGGTWEWAGGGALPSTF